MKKGDTLPCTAEVKEAFEASVCDKNFGCVNLIAFEVNECIEAYWLDYSILSDKKHDEIQREVFSRDDEYKAYIRYNEILKTLIRDMAEFANNSL